MFLVCGYCSVDIAVCCTHVSVCCAIDNGKCLGERTGPTGPYRWLSYGEVEERAVAFGAGLSALGLEPGQESFLGIYSQNNIKVSLGMYRRRLCTRTFWPEIRTRNVCGMQLKVGMVKMMFMMEQLQAASSELSEGLWCTLRLHQIEQS